MSTVHPDDPLFDALAALPPVWPNAGHVERVRDRCHASLRRPAAPLPVAFELATVGAICALYGWHVARIAIRMPLP